MLHPMARVAPAIEALLALPADQRHLGVFRLLRPLGSGGFAPVWLASEVYEGTEIRTVAVKLFALGHDRQAIISEARSLCRVEHPNIVRFYSLAIDERRGIAGLAMEYIVGSTVAHRLSDVGALPVDEVLAIGAGVGSALALAHASNVIHRDVKPANIVTSEGRYKLIDFGVAAAGLPNADRAPPAVVVDDLLLETEDTSAHALAGVPPDAWAAAVTGTLGYICPHCVQGEGPAGPGCDLYSLGATLFECVTGTLPAIVAAKLAGEYGLNANVLEGRAPAPAVRDVAPTTPDPIARMIDSLLRADPTRRPESAALVAQAFDTALRASQAQESARPIASRRSRALDDAVVDRVLERIPALPEPIAALALEVEIARDEGDATGTRKRLFDLSIGVVRYGVSIGLALLVARASGAAAPTNVANPLRSAVKLTDGKWCELARLLQSALRRLDPSAARLLAFASAPAMAEMVAARNAFVHSGSLGDDAPDTAMAVLDAAAALLDAPLRVVASLDPPLAEGRAGIPKRAGVWRRTPSEQPPGVEVGEAYVVFDGSWVRATPWLPLDDRVLRLVDSPRAAGKSWRYFIPETGEHREDRTLDEAMRRFVGDDGTAPRPPVEHPSLVGRAVARDLMKRTMREAATGAVRVLVLDAPQGAGRSRLLRDAAEASAAFELGVVLELFGAADRRSPLGALRLALSDRADASLAAVRAAADRLAAGDALADRVRVDAATEAVEEALVDASRVRGMLVTVDDAQWLDDQTLAVLRLLTERATRGARGRLAVIVSIRAEPTSMPALARFVAQVDRDVGSGATRLTLEPLADGEAQKLVQGVAPMSAEVERHVVDGARGLPFYLVQPLLVWAETASLEWRDGAWRPRSPPLDPEERKRWRNVLASSVPGIAELIDARIQSFFETGSDAETVAQRAFACVALDAIGTSMIRLDAVARALGYDAEVVARVVDALLAAGLLERTDGNAIRVAQPMVARAVLDRARTRAWWSRLHRAYLDVVSAEPDAERDASMLAAGYDALDEQALAVTWYRRAVAQRMGQGAFEEARALAEALAKRERDPAARVRAELSVVDALLRGGDAKLANQRHATIAPASDSREELSWRLAGAAIAAALGRSDVDTDAIVAAADRDADPRLRVEARVLAARRTRGTRGRALLREATRDLDVTVGAGALLGDLRYRALALDLELAYETRDGGIDELRAAAARARGAARDLGSLWAELDVENDSAILEADAGDVERAIGMLVNVIDRAGACHFGSLRRFALVNAATLELRVGREAAARARATQAEEESRNAGDARILAVALSVRSEAELRTGDKVAARRAIEESIAIKESSSDPSLAVALLRRADLRALDGDDEGARADAESARARATAAGNVDQSALARLWLALHALRREGDAAKPALAELVASLEPMTTSLRASTLKKLAEARAALGAAEG